VKDIMENEGGNEKSLVKVFKICVVAILFHAAVTCLKI